MGRVSPAAADAHPELPKECGHVVHVPCPQETRVFRSETGLVELAFE